MVVGVGVGGYGRGSGWVWGVAVDPTVWLVPVARLSNVVAVMPWECKGCEVLRRGVKIHQW